MWWRGGGRERERVRCVVERREEGGKSEVCGGEEGGERVRCVVERREEGGESEVCGGE